MAKAMMTEYTIQMMLKEEELKRSVDKLKAEWEQLNDEYNKIGLKRNEKLSEYLSESFKHLNARTDYDQALREDDLFNNR